MKKNYIYFTVFFTGMAVMVIELIGTRIIAPVYGSGLYAWASLITITLTALACGYFIGGVLADRNPSVKYFYYIIFGAGLSLILVNWLKTPILSWGINLNVKLGTLSSSFFLFFIPLFLLGIVSPFAVKLLTDQFKSLGSVAGRAYAVSTAGSFVGTILAGFVLIPNFRIDTILYFQFIVLAVIFTGYLFVFKIGGRFFSAILIIAISAFMSLLIPADLKIPGIEILYRSGSFHGDLSVVKVNDEIGLYIDSIKQGEIDAGTGLPVTEYVYYWDSFPYFNPAGRKSLIIGLGPGLIAERLRRYGIENTIVEIEPKVEYAARKYFGFSDNTGRIIIADGRQFIERTKEKFDFVILDAFSGDMAPFHLLTQECFSGIKKILSKNGILCLNVIVIPYGSNTGYWKSVYRTLNSVFKSVRAFPPISSVKKPREFASMIFMASDESFLFNTGVRNRPGKSAVDAIKKASSREMPVPLQNEGIILTDRYCPIEKWQAEISRMVRGL